MENASKALLIAGAILICILIIAIGMYIYNSATGTIKTAASQMSQQDKQMYNSMIEKYVGTSKKGSEVKQMINDVISQNNQYVNESGKFISVLSNGVAGFDSKEDSLNNACAAANIYQDKSSKNDQGKIDAATKLMRDLSQQISSGKNFHVQDYQEDGIIYAVVVTPLDSSGNPSPDVPDSPPGTAPSST